MLANDFVKIKEPLDASFVSPLQFPLQNGWGRAQNKMDIHLVLRVGGVGPPHFVDPIL